MSTPARALINPNYTVVDLVRDSGRVFVLRVSAPEAGQVKAEIVEALVGEIPAERELVFDFNDAEELSEYDVSNAFGEARTAVAVMCVEKGKEDDEVLGALEIGTTWMGLVQGKGKSVITEVDIAKHPTAVVCGDCDTDGQLDLMVGGIGGSTLLIRGENGEWLNVIAETGELGAASGLGPGNDVVVAACASDVNGDGRQCAALFHAASGPGLFFNRGFACFGIARSLDLSESRLPAAESLGTGQMTGILSDLNGDLSPDMLAVDRQRGVWAVFGRGGAKTQRWSTCARMHGSRTALTKARPSPAACSTRRV